MLGLYLLGTGLLLFLFSLRAMRPAGASVRPDEPTSSLVVEDPYRITRNPNYLGFTIFYGGITALPVRPTAPFVLVTLRRRVIEREERYLERIFRGVPPV